MELYIAGYVGLKGTVEIANAKSHELATYFPVHMIDRAKELGTKEVISKATKEYIKDKAEYSQAIVECGLFGALWDLSKETKRGFEVYLDKVLLKQETIEISEYYDLNPYRLLSMECFLFGSSIGDIREYFQIDNTPIVHIGRTIDKKAKEIHYDNNILYLTPQMDDEIYRII